MFYSAKFFLEKKNEQQAAVVTSKKAVAVVVISLRYGSGRRHSPSESVATKREIGERKGKKNVKKTTVGAEKRQDDQDKYSPLRLSLQCKMSIHGQ